MRQDIRESLAGKMSEEAAKPLPTRGATVSLRWVRSGRDVVGYTPILRTSQGAEPHVFPQVAHSGIPTDEEQVQIAEEYAGAFVTETTRLRKELKPER